MAGDVENPDEDMAETIDYPVDSVFESVLNEFTETIVGNRLWSKGQSGSNADSIKPQRASDDTRFTVFSGKARSVRSTVATIRSWRETWRSKCH
jgi:hypothetical protein